jgi:hypothetical protein
LLVQAVKNVPHLCKNRRRKLFPFAAAFKSSILVNNNYTSISIIISGIPQDHQGGQPLIVVHGIAADLASVSGGTALTGGKGVIDAESCVFLCAFASGRVILDTFFLFESQHNKPS